MAALKRKLVSGWSAALPDLFIPGERNVRAH